MSTITVALRKEIASVAENLSKETKLYDLNSDGLISREEMFQLLKSSLVKQPTEEEPEEGIRELVEMTFKKLDVDHDGRLTFEDFKAAVENDLLLLEVLGPCLPEQQVAKAFYATFEANS
ncbi:EF-hand calcium-binding domain-containing protein 1 [Cichlidogyrus casuarinus]|uniref:EF-hand calcium-binding domain-containing protein 1 n=1 Tax=Cichlidogyrus casuarinus TaxID=1844966 RepID=A0ABD2PRC5_9PLAT